MNRSRKNLLPGSGTRNPGDTLRLRACLFAFLCMGLAGPGPETARAHSDLNEQVEALTGQITLDPDEARLLLKRGEIHAEKREWDAALADFERAGQLAPDLAAVHLARGEMLYRAGWLLSARASVNRFLAEEPGHPRGLVARARIRDALGLHLQAAEDYSRAIPRLKRPLPEHYIERARALEAAGGEHVGEAVQGLDQGILRLGPVVSLELVAMELEARNKRYDQALERLERIQSASHRKERWLVLRGGLLEETGRAGEARASYLLALESIEALPKHRRGTRAAGKLEKQARQALERLSGKP